ncbi:hypothetical protein EAE92_10130 [Photorhabdus hainanensis]|nr:hypothetical protein [Photorhabdus hainanensis]
MFTSGLTMLHLLCESKFLVFSLLVFYSLGSSINAFGKDLPEKIWENVFCNLVASFPEIL